MNRSQQGFLLGAVLSILLAVAIALALSDERRRQLRHRLEALRNALPDGEHLKQSAQQAASKAREAGSHLGEQMQESANKLGQRTQEMAGAARQTVTSSGFHGILAPLCAARMQQVARIVNASRRPSGRQGDAWLTRSHSSARSRLSTQSLNGRSLIYTIVEFCMDRTGS
jgi:septal ring factor EnvC (AmiA/AmiB activator)